MSTFAKIKIQRKMKRKLAYICFILMFCIMNVNAQKNYHFIPVRNVSIKIPDGWMATVLNKDRGDFSIYAKDSNSKKFVSITCKTQVIEPKIRVNEVATIRSQKQNFDYMQIDKVSQNKFHGNDCQLLQYSNTYLNDTYKGGVYGFVKEGYTYSVEFYGEDMPKDRETINKILSTIVILSPDKQENIIEQEKSYIPENWNKVEENDSEINQNTVETIQKTPKQIEKEKIKAEKQKIKLLKKQQKEKQKLLKIKQKQLKQEQKLKEKQAKENKKAMEKKLKEEKEQKKTKK